MVTPCGRNRAASNALRTLRIQCFVGYCQVLGWTMRPRKVTYDGNNQPKEGRRESHDQIDPLSLQYLVPLYIAGDEEKRSKDPYLII